MFSCEKIELPLKSREQGNVFFNLKIQYEVLSRNGDKNKLFNCSPNIITFKFHLYCHCGLLNLLERKIKV